MKNYYKAEICLNGHVISPYNCNNETFCSTCGSKTISECPKCHAAIRGKEYSDNIVIVSNYTLPNYCYSCGNPYPWTQIKLEALKELVDFDQNLSDDEKSYINTNVQDLTTDTPKTTVVATKFSYYLKKASSVTLSAVRDILVDIASETAKKIIFPEQ